jgi:TetR/AcrR family transcriptional regulator, cholesterol catabolism regulator
MPRKGTTVKRPAAQAHNGASAKPRRRDPEVLEAAAEIFYERGYASATVQDVADALGMLKGSLYYYIESKEDLLYRLLLEIHDAVDELLAAVEAVEGLRAIERLELYVRRTVEFNARNLKRISVYYHDMEQLQGDHLKEIVSRRSTHDRYVVKLIREAQAEGDASPDLDPKLMSNFVFAPIIWMYRWYRPGGGVSVAKLGETCAQFVRFGIRGNPSATGRSK